MIKPLRLAAACLVFVLAACGPGEPPALKGTDISGTPVGGPFNLVDRAGKPVNWEDFNGKYRIVYFGFTFCPDACPTDMAVVMQGYKRLAKTDPDKAALVQPIFISIDPARDTPAKVGEFADSFGAPLIGLTGSAEQVKAAAGAFKVYYTRGAETAGGYLMDHSRYAYLMDPVGKPIETLPLKDGAEAVAADLAAAIR